MRQNFPIILALLSVVFARTNSVLFPEDDEDKAAFPSPKPVDVNATSPVTTVQPDTNTAEVQPVNDGDAVDVDDDDSTVIKFGNPDDVEAADLGIDDDREAVVDVTTEVPPPIFCSLEDTNSTESCEEPNNYPEDLVQGLVAANTGVDSFFHLIKDSIQRDFISNRNSVFEQDELEDSHYLCPFVKKQSFPRVATNKDGTPRWIVNTRNEEFVQVVTTVVCQDTEDSCGGGKFISTGVKTRCKQEYADHKLLAVNDDGTQLILDSFRLPSCCTCEIVDQLEL